MTYLLVCALCAGTPGPIVSLGEALGAEALALELPRQAQRLELDRTDVVLGGARVTLPLLAEHSSSDGPSGQDEGAHMGPMWIVMGVMMIGMMVAVGAYMMRGHMAAPPSPGAVAAPHFAAIPTPVGVRPGG